MREIKFRVMLGKKWYYWGFIKVHGNLCFAGLPSSNMETYTMENLLERSQQYTGLKDKNGKEIYEGDIVDYLKKYWFVKWSNILARYTLVENNTTEMQFDAFYNEKVTELVEIIGNIDENSELKEKVREIDG